ncbi:glycosyl transferase family 2 [Beutenbergia cavernae DSM 12333]|uniref:Glycosyl transferase family 2 n=1 Tax=Beutenbergia cavernae (strain ATCC BAA-8 / DSM 12333 / CCUG 43141 / JCM 11478 / NBRC 16432 / NCIMB 13614 / HKI 0122) TaxID=471853 RepID=C5C125_BEUC1|nr:glycosyltransferase [Beutenbergia cavernae]ACQ79429.1 glycosyl transferase family 2 [Beutenbergia cavernae DSM 12333]
MSAGTPTARARVVAVVVTYNRRDLLRECLDGLAAQTRPLDAVVVIDNASTDGSGDVARAHPIAADVRTLGENLGGAGGFTGGMALALDEHGADWLWLMDDDTIPRPGALEALLDVVDAHPAPLSVLSSAAVWTDGRDHPMNSQRVRPGAGVRELAVAARLGVTPIRTASFVSLLLRAEDVRTHGLPYADYFIWGDDSEYSGRLLRDGWGVRVPASVVEHRTKLFGSWEADPGDRFYYEIRNKLWLYWRTTSFRWWERVLYQGSATLGWLGTIRRSPNKGLLLRHLRHGVLDAVAAPPRPTAEVLAGEPAVADAVRELEDAARGGGEPRVSENARWEADAATRPGPAFSVLLPVYAGDDAAALRRAFDSATREQELPPDEVVLVQDGPVPAALAAQLAELTASDDVAVRLVVLPRNVRLAAALQAGLAQSRHEIVARVDADDVSLPSRFARQVPLVADEGYDVVGSAMREFDADDAAPSVGRVRDVVTEPDEIARAARFRNPLNHPTVVFRRSAVLAVGGYTDLPYMEDYWLWVRMLRAGARVTNVAEPLVLYRTDGVFARRGGIAPLRSDWRFQSAAHRVGFVTAAEAARNLALRTAYRLVPTRLREAGFRLVSR